MLYFGRVGNSWGHRAFFGSSWEEKVITPFNFNFFFRILLLWLYKKIKTSNFLTKLSNYFIPQNNFTIHIILSQYPQNLPQ
jgi:hypothetical protein